MTMQPPLAPRGIEYPDSDGKPMSDNTLQFQWIQVIEGNLEALFANQLDVFVAGDLLWYAEEGHPEVRNTPDVMVVFGRPKGHRGSYKQWEENAIPVTVAFEILSPSNTWQEMADKYEFYEEHGVEEYYIYNPDTNHLQIFLRRGEVLVRQRSAHGFVSPRLGIRFDLSGEDLRIFGPDGQPFLTFTELTAQRNELARERDATAKERDEAAKERDTAAKERDEAIERAERLARRLRELGADPDA